MSISLSDGLLLAVFALSALAYITPTLAAALEARKATRLARVVAAGGRLAATIAVELRGIPPGASATDVKARLVEQAVQRLKAPEMMGHTVAALKGTDAGLANIVRGELAKLELAVAPVPASRDEASGMPAPIPGGGDLGVPLTPVAPPTPYPATSGMVARVVPLLLVLQLAAACGLPQSRATAAFEVEAAYIAAARAGVAYTLAPGADPATAATVRRLERDAYAAVAESRAAPGDAAKLAVAKRQVEALAGFMAEKGVR